MRHFCRYDCHQDSLVIKNRKICLYAPIYRKMNITSPIVMCEQEYCGPMIIEFCTRGIAHPLWRCPLCRTVLKVPKVTANEGCRPKWQCPACKCVQGAFVAPAIQTREGVRRAKAEVDKDSKDTPDNDQTQITLTATLQTKLDALIKLALASGVECADVDKIIR